MAKFTGIFETVDRNKAIIFHLNYSSTISMCTTILMHIHEMAEFTILCSVLQLACRENRDCQKRGWGEINSWVQGLGAGLCCG